MGFMDYMPQWGGAIGTQDISGVPTDDATAQLLLKRRLAQADALRNAEAPQGQMVSGHYVAPSWTQYLANAANKYVGGQQERQAMQDYANAQATKQQKYAELLGQTESGKFQQALAQMPEFQQDLVKARLAAMNKEDQPINVAQGGALVNRKGEVIYQNPKEVAEKSGFGNVSPSDFTPQSLAKYAQTKNFADLVPVPKQATPAQPYFQAIPTGQGYARFNARTGQMEAMPLNGQTVLPAAQTPGLQGDIASAKFQGEAEAKRGFNMAGASDIVNNARSILSGKIPPTGSGIGTSVDAAGAVVGYTPKGASQDDQLRAISGQLVAKMPRMEGPQSDRDVQLYTQMAGQIGDSTIPVKRRLEALQTVEGIIKKYEPKKAMGVSQDQQALQWANANPNDPRARAIKQKLGVE